MKKKYIIPWMKIVTFRHSELLTGSRNGVHGVVNKKDVPQVVLQYEGVDEDGELDPD